MMSSVKWTVLTVAAVFGIGSPAAQASQINLYNTGVANDGSLLAAGATDPHYQLTTNNGTPTPAVVGTVGAVNTAFPFWAANTASSQWIVPTAVGGIGVGDYVYHTTFDLTGIDPSTVKITGGFAADDSATITLNGSATGITTTGDGFSALTPFTLKSGFVSGINSLDFHVHDYNGVPTGLQVKIGLGPDNPVPEPSVLALGGLTALALLARKVRGRRPRTVA